jgi:hypothetical protein
MVMLCSEILRVIVQPSRSRSSAIIATSAIFGTLFIVDLPGAKRVTAINFKTEFFAP